MFRMFVLPSFPNITFTACVVYKLGICNARLLRCSKRIIKNGLWVKLPSVVSWAVEFQMWVTAIYMHSKANLPHLRIGYQLAAELTRSVDEHHEHWIQNRLLIYGKPSSYS